MDNKISNLINAYAEENGISFGGACVLIFREIDSQFLDQSSSTSRTLSAAHSAYAAINRHFEHEIKSEDWGNLARLQKAALEAALASVII